jgi:hypothetical protein
MSKLALKGISIMEVSDEYEYYRVIVSAWIEDAEFEEHSSEIDIVLDLPMDTKDLNEIEQKAIAKAENLLKAVLKES